MIPSQLVGIAPLIMLAAGSLLVMLQIAVQRRPMLTRFLTSLVFIAALLASFQDGTEEARQIGPLLLADSLALFLCAVFSLTGAAVTLLSADLIEGQTDEPDEYYLLLLLATMGACVLVYANHVVSLLLGLELLSVSLYALVAYPSRQQKPIEAATKYLVLSGAATATILFGFALLYTATGSLSFAGIGARMASADIQISVPLMGAAMVMVGLGFKLAAAPLHLWTPDVYEGAPSPVTALLASVAKVAPFIVLLRLFLEADLFRFQVLIDVTVLFAGLSMIIGNLLALLQTNLKRMLAYSSIAHIGYLFIVFSAGADGELRPLAGEAAAFYLIAYVPTVIAALSVLCLLHTHYGERDNITLDSVTGLFWRNPLLATLMMVALLSLAGIPLTAGFIGKLYIFSAAVAGEHWLLLALLIVGTGLGIYYYLRVVYQMTRSDGVAASSDGQMDVPLSTEVRAVALALLAGILVLGVIPQPLMHYLSRMF